MSDNIEDLKSQINDPKAELANKEFERAMCEKGYEEVKARLGLIEEVIKKIKEFAEWPDMPLPIRINRIISTIDFYKMIEEEAIKKAVDDGVGE